MTKVSIEIPLTRVDSCNPSASHGNQIPLLHEVRHALARLLETGERSCIDLHSLPMGPGDEAVLEVVLGIGEVEASITALGNSSVVETSFPGVWLVTHRNEEGRIVSRFIEVTHVPRILESQVADIRSGYQRLGAELDRPARNDEMDRREGMPA